MIWLTNRHSFILTYSHEITIIYLEKLFSDTSTLKNISPRSSTPSDSEVSGENIIVDCEELPAAESAPLP